MSLGELKAEGHLRGPLLDPDDFCIDWYQTDTKGYPVVYNPRTKVLGLLCRILMDAPPDLTVDHLCQNKSCIQIDHLELVTGAENHRRRSLFYRSEVCGACGSYNFRFVGRNRQCIPCGRAYSRRYRAEQSADPSRRRERNKQQLEWHHKNKEQINAARRAKYKQARLLPQ